MSPLVPFVLSLAGVRGVEHEMGGHRADAVIPKVMPFFLREIGVAAGACGRRDVCVSANDKAAPPGRAFSLESC